MTETAKHNSVLDPGAEQVGKTYAQALLGAAQKEGVADRVVREIAQLVDEYLRQSEPLSIAFQSLRIKPAEKMRVIDRLFGDEFHPILVRFLKVMADHERLAHVDAVRVAAEDLLDESMGRAIGYVESAVALDESLRALVIDRLSSAMNREIRLVESVNPDLVGGMVIRIGDTMLDGSVTTQLEKMRAQTRQGFSSQLLRRFDQFMSRENDK